MEVDFVQTSRSIDVISDNDNKSVWKIFLFLQICTTRDYDWIKMLVLTDVFFFESTLYKMDCLPFVYCSPPNRTSVNMTSFSHSYVRSYLEFRPPENCVASFRKHRLLTCACKTRERAQIVSVVHCLYSRALWNVRATWSCWENWGIHVTSKI